MKILVFTKRYTSAKDISREDVGRPYCLFAALRDLGHEVDFLLADYTDGERRDVAREGLRFMIRPLTPLRLISFGRTVRKILHEGGYDILIAEGDPLFARLASGACRADGVPLVYDLMDNYETYDIYRFPLFRLLDRRSLRRADLVVCVTDALRDKISSIRRGDISVVGNGVDLERFHPMDRRRCRERLGLSGDARIIGYFGYLVDYKGIDILLRAFEILRSRGFSTVLLLAGNRHKRVSFPEGDILYRGLIRQSEVPEYINACDAVVVPSPSNAYTDYCFPLKILEGMACNVPVVATALGPVREICGGGYPWLVKPGDARDLSQAIEKACGASTVDSREIAMAHSWRRRAEELENALGELVRG